MSSANLLRLGASLNAFIYLALFITPLTPPLNAAVDTSAIVSAACPAFFTISLAASAGFKLFAHFPAFSAISATAFPPFLAVLNAFIPPPIIGITPIADKPNPSQSPFIAQAAISLISIITSKPVNPNAISAIEPRKVLSSSAVNSPKNTCFILFPK